MRMDRYEDSKEEENLKTRTTKNQELYTDVYMNNVYLDINNLKNVMNEDDDSISKENNNLKLVRENKVSNYTYEDKIYDINVLIEEAINNKKDDNVKRSLDIGVANLEIENLIETIQENKEKENDQELLADLVTGDDSTAVIAPNEVLENNNKTNEDSSNDVNLKESVTNDIDNEDIENEDKDTEVNNENIDNEIDNSFIKPNGKKKIVFIILGIIIILAIVAGILFYKGIIKF